jgi:predicted regulator of Ras-like GTPase activity (Roadblock/LC7/MglB family)
MKNFPLIAKCPEVIGAVLSDPQGALLQASGDIEAESVGAVLTYTSQSLARAGEHLGLGALSRAVVTGPGKTCFIVVRAEGVLGVYVDATKPASAFEKKLEELLQR